MAADALFTPWSFKGLKLPNRVVMAPMTRSHSPGGVATEAVAQYYARRAEAEVGLIISEGTGVDRPVSLNDPNVPRFHGESELAGWKRVIDAVHAKGGVMAPQLWHVGAVRSRHPDWQPEKYDSPSGKSRPDKVFGEAMTDEEVADAIRAFGEAARHAKELGFESVELHGAHGYLIDQFFWEATNQRTDAFGGSLIARTRFGADVVRAVRAAVGPDFPLILRWSQWKQQDYAAKLAATPELLEEFLAPLTDAGVDIYHCSQRRFWEAEFEGSDMNLAGWVKKISGKPTITVGSVGLSTDFITSFAAADQVGATGKDLAGLAARFERGEFDLVAVGRAVIANPDWVNRVRAGDIDGLKGYDPASLATLY